MYYNSFLYLIFYFFSNVLGETLTEEQTFLKRLTAKDFSKGEADYLWARINDHKWYISEKLRRDVGITVAAVDFFENIYESESGAAKPRRFNKSNLRIKKSLSSFA